MVARLRMAKLTRSYFAAYVLCMMHFVMHGDPFLPARVALAPESSGPIVQWRSGGATSHLVRAYHHAPHFRAFWISGERQRAPMPMPAPARRLVLLYVHGGGFSFGSVALYAEPLLRILSHCSLMAPEVSIECVAVEYDLVPQARFPTPLLQVLRCYAHLLEVERVPASSIVMAGDSAGGNLVLSALLCLAGQATPEVAERAWHDLPLPAKAVLISPWLDLRPRESQATRVLPSMATSRPATRMTPSRGAAAAQSMPSRRALKSTRSRHADVLSPAGLVQFAQTYVGALPRARRVQGPASRLCEHWAPYTTGVRATCRAVLLQPPLSLRFPPLLPQDDAQSDAVPSADQLFGVPAAGSAKRLADPLVSPTLGDWRHVDLEHGFFVTWGAHELMAPDIALWAERMGAAAETHVEHGTAGVHVWPYLQALLAPRLAEREMGLQMLASAIVSVGVSDQDPCMDSPQSLPSDTSSLDDEDAASTQRAWDAGLASIGVDPPAPVPPAPSFP